jgi:hypothetical protein
MVIGAADSDSDISLPDDDYDVSRDKGKGKGKGRADKKRADKGKGKAKDTVRSLCFVCTHNSNSLSKHTLGRLPIRVHGRPYKRMRLAASILLLRS